MYDHFVWNSPQNCFTRCVLILKESQSNCFWWVLRIVDAHGKWLDASICPKFCPEIKLEMCAWRIPVIGHFGGHLGIFETFIVHSLLRRGRILIKFNNVRGTHPYCHIVFVFFFCAQSQMNRSREYGLCGRTTFCQSSIWVGFRAHHLYLCCDGPQDDCCYMPTCKFYDNINGHVEIMSGSSIFKYFLSCIEIPMNPTPSVFNWPEKCVSAFTCTAYHRLASSKLLTKGAYIYRVWMILD